MPTYEVQYVGTALVEAETEADAKEFINQDLDAVSPDQYEITEVREVKKEV